MPKTAITLCLLLPTPVLLAALAPHALLLGRAGPNAPARTDPARPFHLVVSGPTAGALEPCGCSAGMLGGMDRRPTLLQALSSKPGTLLVDCGDFVAPPRLPYLPVRPLVETIKLNLVLRALATMPYQVYSLGERDLVVPPFVDDLATAKPYDEDFYGLASVGQMLFDTPPVLTNVTTDVPDLWVPARLIKDSLGRRILSTCVIAESSPRWAPAYRYRDPVKSLRAVIAQYSSSSPIDLVLCIYHGETFEGARRLARAVDGIGLILFADAEHSDDASTPPALENGAAIVRPGDRGRSVLELSLTRQEGRTTLQSIASHHVDEHSVSDSTLKTLTHEYRQRAAAHSPPLVASYAGLTFPPEGNLYVGSAACRRCHEKDYKIWKDSKHAHAYETLVNKDEANQDPACVRCHTVGYGSKLGFGDPRLADLEPRLTWRGAPPVEEDLKGVGCENCHGPGLLHSLRPSGANKIPMIVHKVDEDAESSCGGCHDGENSVRFEFKSYWEKIKH